MNFSKIKDTLISFIFSKRCRFCDSVTDIREDVCEKCKSEIPRISGEICYRCGCAKADCICGGKSAFYESVCAPYYYEGAVKKAIYRLKFCNSTKTADILADDMAQAFKLRYGELQFDMCTFVPSHKNEYKKRGYNQAQLIARRFCEITGIPYCEILEKNFETAPQHSLNKSRRSGNLLGAFNVKEGVVDTIADKRILICDDVKTTGATLDECAKTLLINGAAEVRCITACITRQSVEKQTSL